MTSKEIAQHFNVYVKDYAPKLEVISKVVKSPEDLTTITNKLGASNHQMPIDQVYEYAKLDSQLPEME